MSNFIYKARDAEGKLVEGIVDAEGQIMAASKLEAMGLSPVNISAGEAVRDIRGRLSRRRMKVSRQEALLFTRQLSTLISTGVPLIEALEAVNEQAENFRLKQIISQIIQSLKSGSSFSEALVVYPDVFGRLYVSMIKVGEAGGILDKVLNRLAELGTKEIDMRSRLRSALMYPVVLAVVAFIIVNFVLVGVLPKFVAIFEASSAKLPLATRLLLFLSFILRNFWWLLGFGVILFSGWLRRYYRSEAGRYKIDSLILRLPILGPLTLKIIVSQFSRSVAALTQSGIPVLEALSVVEPSVSNVVLQNIIQDIRSSISQGESLTEPFKASGLFPAMVIQLINTGEKSGKIDLMFDEIADFYEPEVEFALRNLTSLLEPVMLLGMGLVVAFIALSVLLPIFNLISVIRR